MSSAASPRLAAPAASLATFGLQRRVVEVEKSVDRALGCVLQQLGGVVFVDSCREEAARCALPVGSILLRVNLEAAPRDLKRTSARITESSRLRLELFTHAQAREVRVGGGAEARGLSLAPAGPYARVLRVDEHSEAHRAGIRLGDLVLAMDGAMLPSVRATHRALRTSHELTLRIFSGDLLDMGADWPAFMRTVAHLQAVELHRNPVASENAHGFRSRRQEFPEFLVRLSPSLRSSCGGLGNGSSCFELGSAGSSEEDHVADEVESLLHAFDSTLNNTLQPRTPLQTIQNGAHDNFTLRAGRSIPKCEWSSLDLFANENETRHPDQLWAAQRPTLIDPDMPSPWRSSDDVVWLTAPVLSEPFETEMLSVEEL